MRCWPASRRARPSGAKATFRRAAKAAELRSLRYQVNPHFLFNTLNSLSALVLTGKTEEAERMIQTISTFYRRSLADDPTADVPLREEFELQRLYLDIEAVRFPDRLQARLRPAGRARRARWCPGMILQPLVENSVKHAVAPASSKVTITHRRARGIRAAGGHRGRRRPGAGRGAPAGAGFGIGLGNVRERLAGALRRRRRASCPGPTASGYATHIRIPLVRHG